MNWKSTMKATSEYYKLSTDINLNRKERRRTLKNIFGQGNHYLVEIPREKEKFYIRSRNQIAHGYKSSFLIRQFASKSIKFRTSLASGAKR